MNTHNDAYGRNLSPSELEDSLPLVCYERSLYHFARNQALQHFFWLYADRHYHMHHVPNVNEALQFQGDGLSRLLKRIESIETVPHEDILPLLRNRLRPGTQARAMLLTNRPDGTVYNTSTLIEEPFDDGFLVTKTNEHNHKTRTYVSGKDLLSRFSRSPDRVSIIGFLHLDPGLKEQLSGLSGARLLRFIMLDLYGYQTAGEGGILMDGHAVDASAKALYRLVDEVQENRSSIMKIQTDKGLQLRLNKHIGNKLQPLWRTWRHHLLRDAELVSLAPEETVLSLKKAEDCCQRDYAELRKHFILFYGRPSETTFNSYVRALTRLAETHHDWTRLADKCLTSIMHASL